MTLFFEKKHPPVRLSQFYLHNFIPLFYIIQILGTLLADLIVVEVECGECLHEDRSGEMWKRRERERDAEIVGLTVLCRSASLTYWAPFSPISLPPR